MRGAKYLKRIVPLLGLVLGLLFATGTAFASAETTQSAATSRKAATISPGPAGRCPVSPGGYVTSFRRQRE